MKYKMTINGPQIPNGIVKVSGAKNSATKLLAASLLSNEIIRINNFPTQLVDAKAKIGFIRDMGVEVDVDDKEESLTINSRALALTDNINYELPIRTTYLLAAGQIVRHQKAHIPYPGGCKIGSRGYDLHIMVWEKLGCKVEEKEKYIEIKGGFKGGVINFPISTVGGTETAIMCASVAEGVTEIHNAYITPEVDDLIDFLVSMGAKIEKYGTAKLKIEGQNGLLKGTSYSVMPDRIEALTWMVFAAITKGSIVVENVPFKTMEIPLLHLKDCGIDFYQNENSVYITPTCIKGGFIQPFEVACGTHPGVISDMQAFYVLLGLVAEGKSTIFDYRYPERIAYGKELNKFTDEKIKTEYGKIITYGTDNIKGAEVLSTDLRGSMGLIMEGFLANGTSVIKDIFLAMRGYNNLEIKLRDLGLEFEIE